MEMSIMELIQQSREHRTQQALLPVSQQKSNEVVATYGERERFLTTFNPDAQREICVYDDVCFFGGAPTLFLLNNAYGSQTAAMWLVPQLYNLSEYCGCKDKLSGGQLKECASVIASQFGYLSVTELMLFFYRFKSGRYGRFYGSVDPLVITTSLRDFLKERANAYDKHEQEQRRKKDEEGTKMTWEEYSMKTYGEVRTHPLERKPELPKQKKEVKKGKPDDVLRMARAISTDTLSDSNTKAMFSKKFKEKYGITPEEYVLNHENK